MNYQHILKFWYEETNPSQWWVKDEAFDQQIIDRYSEVHARASRCELFDWRTSAAGRLAEVIILDQFSRNMYRDSANSFAFDSLALALAQEAVSLGADRQLNSAQKHFLYMPYMHSESAAIHEVALQLFSGDVSQAGLDSEIRHGAIIRQFGRYPHRNDVLGRVSTPEEIEFLKQPGSSF